MADTLPPFPLKEQLLMVNVPDPPGTAWVNPMPEDGLAISPQNSAWVDGLGTLVMVTGGC